LHPAAGTGKTEPGGHQPGVALPQGKGHPRTLLLVTLTLSRKAGSSYFNHLFLPFLIPKFYDFYRPRPPSPLHPPKESLSFRYNKKMLPKSSSLKGYF